MNNQDLILQLKEEHNLSLPAWRQMPNTPPSSPAKSPLVISAIRYFSAASSNTPITAATTAIIAVSAAATPMRAATV